ncbi:MerR family transcriptional regulator [Paenibacillus sp. YPG26]|uniref:MerR family transcriptional regulator n=1 Tax=Paenibacillus sp. YPG26 TaxID=2878915 RepID=UPI00203BA3D0|nr:MerR family transcriptional regulator [Paenibacillus sp. YPG26]USB32909.1 MerR family transcriptional regulator [Paenibacillus sp. YPG26]
MYSIKQVSAMLNIPTVTIRAWENRYEAVVPERTDAGYRLYTEENVEDLKWLKAQVEERGATISQAVKMLKSRKKEEDQASALLSELPKAGDQTAYAKMEEQIYEALLSFQGERANGLIDFGFSLYGYDAMFYHVLVPVLIRVGAAWEQGRASVAQEHYMTQLISQRFFQFFHLFPVNHLMPKALSFCPPGEHHQVGLLLFSLFLRKHGVEVLYLGANTPEEDLVRIIHAQDISLVCLSLTDPSLIEETDELVSRLKSACPHITVALGGKAYERSPNCKYPESVLKLPAEEWKDWLESLVRKSSKH